MNFKLTWCSLAQEAVLEGSAPEGDAVAECLGVSVNSSDSVSAYPLDAAQLASALSHDVIEQRLRILALVHQEGSISAAARSAGTSYKSAWQALDHLRALAGMPLVEAIAGGRAGGGARLTEAGEQLLRVHARLQAVQQAFLDTSTVRSARSDTVISTESQSELSQPDQIGWSHSMRNRLRCEVVRIEEATALVQVVLRLAPDAYLRAVITRESLSRFALVPGMSVWALCKATAVRIIPLSEKESPVTEKGGMDGVVRGVVVGRGEASNESASSADIQEVTLALGDRQLLVGFGDAANLVKGQIAQAFVAPEAIVLAR